jgi:hypothetical protein
VKKNLKENIDDEEIQPMVDERQTEQRSAEVEADEDIAREDLKFWLQMVADIHMRGGHIDALAYALPEGDVHVEFGGCDVIEGDPAGFLRWLADGLVPTDGPGGDEVTRH